MISAGGDVSQQGPVAMATGSDAAQQQWQLVRVYGQFYRMVNARSGMCLNLSGSDGVSVLQWGCVPGQGAINELWIPTQRADPPSRPAATPR